MNGATKVTTIRMTMPIIKRSLTRKENYKGRPLLMMDMDGNVLKRFDGIRDAEKYIKKPHTGHISDCCNNKRHSAYGYFWKWEDNNLIKLYGL